MSEGDSTELIDALVQATFATMAVLNNVAAGNDLSLTQLRVLAILRDRRLRVTALAGYLGLDKSTVSGLIDRAEQRGLVARAADPDDRRAVEVALTPSGARLAAAGFDQVAQSLAPVIGRLGAAERARLQALLRRMLGPEPV